MILVMVKGDSRYMETCTKHEHLVRRKAMEACLCIYIPVDFTFLTTIYKYSTARAILSALHHHLQLEG